MREIKPTRTTRKERRAKDKVEQGERHARNKWSARRERNAGISARNKAGDRLDRAERASDADKVRRNRPLTRAGNRQIDWDEQQGRRTARSKPVRQEARRNSRDHARAGDDADRAANDKYRRDGRSKREGARAAKAESPKQHPRVRREKQPRKKAAAPQKKALIRAGVLGGLRGGPAGALKSVAKAAAKSKLPKWPR